ncbi:MAG: tripartite tricarboxylate transporter substrate binding protein [Burkholderiales bacterium]|nr:tripartite tricarboxylate transporter substrate binding protein [Burkholderiales bacterium]
MKRSHRTHAVNPHRRAALGTTAAAAALAMSYASGARAQSAAGYPNRPVKMVVASAAGGILDTVGRLVATRIGESMGQNVVVENRAGAGGILGTEVVARAAPDGYTVCKVATSHAINPGLYPKMPYDTLKDFVAVSQTVNLKNVLVAHPSVGVNTVKELIALAKAKPRAITFASAGNGQSNHLSGEIFRTMAGVEMVHVPYKGSAPGLTDTVAGNTSIMFVDILSALPHIKSGRLKALGVTGDVRSPALLDVPTIADSLPGFNGNTWLGLVAPAGTPRDIVAKLSAETHKALNAPDVKERLLAQGVEPVGSTPEQFAAHIESEMARYAAVVKSSGAKVD